jgi:hypothetical protein
MFRFVTHINLLDYIDNPQAQILPASSQAIAESVTLGAATSIAGTKAGSALSSALNRSSKQIAGRVQQQVPRPQTKKPWSEKKLASNTQNTGAADHRPPQPGELTVSIQGAEPNCAFTNEQTSVGQRKGTRQWPTNCLSPNTSGKPASTKYKSVVTVTFPN